jgi:hypothetical protein
MLAPTPPHHKQAPSSHQQPPSRHPHANGSAHNRPSQPKGATATSSSSSASSGHQQVPTIDANLSFSAGTPSFPLSPSSPCGSPNYLDHGMMSLMTGLPMTPFSSFGSPEGEPLDSTPSNNNCTASSSAPYRWDPRNTPLLNLAYVSESFIESGPSTTAVPPVTTSPPYPPTNQRVTRSQSSQQQVEAPVPLIHHKKALAGRPRTRQSPRSSHRSSQAEEIDGLGQSLLSLSPVGMRSPKYLPSPETQSQFSKRGREAGGQGNLRSEVDGGDEINSSDSAIFNTTNESPEEKAALPLDHHVPSVQLRSRLEDPQPILQQNRRKRRRDDARSGAGGSSGEDGDEDNIFRVAIADSSELRCLSPVRLRALSAEEVN